MVARAGKEVGSWHIASFRCDAEFGRFRSHSGHRSSQCGYCIGSDSEKIALFALSLNLGRAVKTNLCWGFTRRNGHAHSPALD
jgi:hypothetical protein